MVVSPLNDTEIVIMGGYDEAASNEVFIFDTQTKILTEVCSGISGGDINGFYTG